MNNLIEVTNLNKSFETLKKVRVLKKVSFKFKKGKIYSLIGPSGSGKSTFLNLLSLIDRPSSGSISIQNKKMYLNGSECEQIIIKNEQRDTTNNIDINPIIAGRGFHWQKEINVRVVGNVIIQVIDQSLFVINKIYLEDYLMCVATSEMGSECPSSLLEAQTIVARSWILAATEKKHTKL